MKLERLTGTVGAEVRGVDADQLLFDENAPGKEALRYLAASIPSIKDDMQRLVAFARQAEYLADVLWNDPLFRARVAALQAELDALEQMLARAMLTGDGLALLARIAGSQLQQKVGDLVAEAIGPYGLAQDPPESGGQAADGSPGPLEVPGANSILAFRDTAALGNGEALGEIVAATDPRLSGTKAGPTLPEADAKLRDAIDRFAAAEYAPPKRAELLAANRDNWDRFAAMGWLGLGIPEEAGGLGSALTAMMLVAERLGAGLAMESFAGNIVYPSVALQALLDPAGAAKLLAPAVAGRIRLAVACHEAPARGGLRWTNTRATPDKGGYVLEGCKVAVDGGGTASAYLVSARTAGEVYDPFGHSLFLVPRDAPGLKVSAWRMAGGSDMAALELDGVRVPEEALLGEPGTALVASGAGMDAAIVANAFGVVGAMEAALAATAGLLHEDAGPVDPRFLRQSCADMLVALEQARSAALLGLASLSQPDGRQRAYVTSATKAVVVRASKVVCGQAIQLHGGIGVPKDGRIDHFSHFAEAANSLRGSLDFHLGRMAMLM